MTNQKALFHWILIVTLLVSIVFLSACKTSTEPEPEPEPPREPEPVERVGTKEFTITIIQRSSEEELTGYDIEIGGPVTVSESGVSSAQFTIEDVVSGEYTITVSKDGFVTSEVTEELEVPEAQSADFFAETTVSLRKTTPPVKVNNSEATTVKTGKPDTEDAEDDEEVSIQIPANTFPPEVVSEDGTVDISVTRTKPSQAKRSESGQVSESILLTPAATLNNPVTVTIPVREIEGYAGLEYVLQPGNIPMTPDGNGNLVATIQPDVSTDGLEARLDFGASIDQFREYTVTATNLEISATNGFTQFRNIADGQCGAAVVHNYVFQGVTIGGLGFYGDYDRFTRNRSIQITIPAVEDKILRVQARNRTRTYTVRINGNVVHTHTVNLAIVNTNEPQQIDCHNSGGT